jgi:hypothetical protein
MIPRFVFDKTGDHRNDLVRILICCKENRSLLSANPIKRSKLLIGICATFLLFAGSAVSHAFVLELGGGAVNRSNGLYLHNRDGREVEVVEVDARQDDLPILSDLGQPSVSDDGSVLFGGMVFEAKLPRWRRANRWGG